MNHPDNYDHIDDSKTGCLVPAVLLLLLAAILLFAGWALR